MKKEAHQRKNAAKALAKKVQIGDIGQQIAYYEEMIDGLINLRSKMLAQYAEEYERAFGMSDNFGGEIESSNLIFIELDLDESLSMPNPQGSSLVLEGDGSVCGFAVYNDCFTLHPQSPPLA